LYFLYILSVGGLGFIFSTSLFGILTLRYIFKLKWLAAFSYSIALTIVFHVVFFHFLGVPLPRGLPWKIIEALNLIGAG